MRNEIAEWLLSQVAAPEQARTVLGDLLEDEPGPVMFWVGALRATMSIATHQPGRTLWSAFWFLYDAALYYATCFWMTHGHLGRRLPLAGVGVVLWMVIRLGIYRRFHVSGSSMLAAPVFFVWFWNHEYGWPVALSSLAMAPAVVLGWWMQWRSQCNKRPGDNRPIVS